MTDSQFSPDQWLNGLLPEISSARSALATADRLLREDGPIERDLDGILAIYSIGVERLLKLSLGIAAVDNGQPWPAKMSLTREGWGHAITAMDSRLRETLRRRIAEGPFEQAALLNLWLRTLENDPIWQAVVQVLEAYADKGRYYHLDQMSSSIKPSPNPKEMWDQMEHAAIESHPALSEMYQQVLAGEVEWDDFERLLRKAVADSIQRWVAIIACMGMHKVLGEDGATLGADALPVGALPIVTLPGC